MNTGRLNFFLKGLIVFSIFALLFYVGISVFASPDMNDSFELYGTGNISGNGNWIVQGIPESSGFSEAQVVDDFGYAGDHSILFSGTTREATYDTGTTTPDMTYFSAYVYVSSSTYLKIVPAENNSNPSDRIFSFSVVGNATSSYWYTDDQETSYMSVQGVDTWVRVQAYSFESGDYEYIIGNDIIPSRTPWPNSFRYLHFYTGNTNGTTYVDHLGYGFEWDLGIDEVTIYELPEWHGEIQIGSANFAFTEHTYCELDDTDCVVRIDYGFQDIGTIALLMPEDAASVEDYVDLVELTDKPLLYETLTPTLRSASTTDAYRIFLIPETGSSTLTDLLYVHWVEELEADDQIAGIMSYFKNIFPLSIIIQIKDMFTIWGSDDYTPINLTFNDLIPAEYSGVTSTSTILSSELITDNLSLWEEKIIPFMELFVWLFTFLYIIFRFKSAMTTDTNE